jgi:hypothetical protein
VSFEAFDVLGNDLRIPNSLSENKFRQCIFCSLHKVINHIFEESTANADWNVQFWQFILRVLLSSKETEVHNFENVLAEDSAEFASIVPIESKTFANGKVFVPLTELTDFSTRKNLVFGRLKVGFDDESAVVHQTVFVDDVEYFLVDVNQPRSYEETRWCVQFFPLLLF